MINGMISGISSSGMMDIKASEKIIPAPWNISKGDVIIILYPDINR